jgi:acyl-coenzyme A thioesterase PaaI-like protein
MTNHASIPQQPDPDSIRQRVLRALAGNRDPGFHFPGYFLDLSWPRIGKDAIEQAMAAGAHCFDAHGAVHAAAVGVMVDGALATAPRPLIETGARLATVHLDMQFTGHAPSGALHMEAAFEGFFAGNAVKQALSRGVLTSDGEPVCYATGTFVMLPPPVGVKLAPLPWQLDGEPKPPLDLRELDAKERAVVRAAEAAVNAHDGQHTFIERFWGITPKHTATGATCRVKIGPQIGNRVGHVQGGILIGLAQATASAAVPRHPVVSNISAWYISPGHGKALAVRSKVIHAGRSFAVVRTEVKNADGTRVLEAVSNHAARRS